MPRPHFTPGEVPAPILQEAGWAPGPVWTGQKSHPHRDSIPGLPARSQSLYRLSYPADTYIRVDYTKWRPASPILKSSRGTKCVAELPQCKIKGSSNTNKQPHTFCYWTQITFFTAISIQATFQGQQPQRVGRWKEQCKLHFYSPSMKSVLTDGVSNQDAFLLLPDDTRNCRL